MKKVKYVLLLMSATMLALCVKMPAQAAGSNTIQNGIFIRDIDVSGMTADEATKAVTEKVNKAKSGTITIVSPTGATAQIVASEIGLDWSNPEVIREAVDYGKKGNVVERYKAKKDIEREPKVLPLDLTLRQDDITAVINENEESFNQEAVNYSLEMVDGSLNVVTGQAGVIVNAQESAKNLSEYMLNEWDGSDTTFDLVSEVDEPLGSAEDLSKIKDIIGTFTTEYKKSGAARVANVANGCRLINGTTVYPGEEFSVLDTITPFSESNGYRMAGSYMNGLVVDTLGGGICQVSSTLYNAVLNAELEVTARQNHSMIVDYVEPSGDAAIAESSHKDFRFVNNRDYPIYIEGYTTAEKTITFNIYGIEDRPENRVVTYSSEVLERTVPETENIIADGGQPIGYTSITSAHTGIKARYIKTVTVDGVVQSSEVINNSTYKMVPRTLVVGVATDNPDFAARINEAIATGSIDETRAVAGAIAAQNAAAQAAAEAAVQAGDP